jgi:hypothetical protein
MLFTCNSQIEKKSERFIPQAKGSETFDTIIASRNIQIIISKTNLDSHVVNEYLEGDHKQIDKYRDSEIELKIIQNSQTIFDTILRKEQFSTYGDEGFMEIAIIHNYWFNQIDNEKIELFGVINQPETDYSIAFYHYFDLMTGNLIFEEYTEDED